MDLNALGKRLEEWNARTHKTVLSLSIAVGVSDTAVRGWTKGKSEPSASSLMKLHSLGLDVMWLLTGEGEMFSDTPAGREWAKEAGVKVGRPRSTRGGDRAPVLVAEIESILAKYK